MSHRLRWALAVGALLMLPLIWQLFGPRGADVTVVRQMWRLEIEVERHLLESASGWCDELPPDAREVGRRLLSDPTSGRPAPAEHCRYTQPQWRTLRLLQAQGDAPSPPRWPQINLSPLPPDQLGAERPGERRAFYEIELRAADDRRWICRLPQRRWQDLPPRARFRLQVDRQGVADCASLSPLS